MGAIGKSKEILKKLPLVSRMAQDGYTNAQIAKHLGIATSTFNEYKKKFPEFSEALKKGSEIADDVAEASLFAVAMGYRYEEITKEVLKHAVTGKPILDEDGKPKMIVTKIVERAAHPNTTALIFWLKNRRPDIWNDRRDKVVDAPAGDSEEYPL